MCKYIEVKEKMKTILKEEDIKIDEPMKNHTSFKVGGKVDILVTPENKEELIEIIKICKEYNAPIYIIGNGSNLLVKDGGIKGVVIKLLKLNNINVDGDRVTVGSGSSIAKVCREALKSSLTGLEFACGIPGSVGGAIAMNAGAYRGEIKDVLESALVVDRMGNMHLLKGEHLELGYRKSALLNHNYIAVEATFKLEKGNYDSIKERIDNLMGRRREKQPLEFPSAGSTFKRPEGHFAAKLIEDSGLKGANVGDAEVSQKHSGFIINKGNATAKDVLDLIALVQKTVKEKFDVKLDTEVRIIGEEK